MRTLNFALGNYCRTIGVEFISPWDAYIDRTVGGWLAGSSLDTTHPVAIVANNVAKKICDQYQDLVLRNPIMAPYQSPADGSLFTNTFLAIDTNVDGVADGVTKVGAGGTYTLVDNPIGIGRAQRMVATSVASGTPSSFKTTFAGYAIGTKYLIGFDLVTSGFSNASLVVNLSTGGVNKNIIIDAGATAGLVSGSIALEHTVPVGSNRLEFSFTINSFDGSNPYSGTVSLGRVYAIPVTAIESYYP
jgi:hypothetical protein